MSDYVIAPRRDGTVSIAKFDWSDLPVAVYSIKRLGNGQLKCDCPGSWRSPRCKHVQMPEVRLAFEFLENRTKNRSKLEHP